MLELIDETLEAFFRSTVPLSATDVDVSFEAPDRDWSAKLSRPTVNLFLWDLRRSSERASSGLRTVVRDGVAMHQPPLPTVELRYVVTAWTSDHGDERGLLSGLMRASLSYNSIPSTYAPDGMAGIDAPTLLLARAGEDHMDVFKALEGQVKPGINIVLTTQFDTDAGIPAGPPVTTVESAVGQIGRPPEVRRRVAGEIVSADELGAIGALVRSPTDATKVNEFGRFLLRAEIGDEIVLDTSPPRITTVPTTGGVRFE